MKRKIHIHYNREAANDATPNNRHPNVPLAPEANFAEPTLLPRNLSNPYANSNLPSRAAHKRNLLHVDSLVRKGVPVSAKGILRLTKRLRVAPPTIPNHEVGPLDDLVVSSAAIKAMAAAGSTYGRIGFDRNDFLAAHAALNKQTGQNRETDAADPHYVNRLMPVNKEYDGATYVTKDQSFAEAQRAADYRDVQRKRPNPWKHFTQEEVINSITPTEGPQTATTFSKENLVGKRTTDGKSRRYVNMGRDPANSSLTNEHIRKIYRLNGKTASPEFWRFPSMAPPPSVPETTTYVSPGHFYAGLDHPITSHNPDWRLGEVPAGSLVQRSSNAGEVMMTPKHTEIDEEQRNHYMKNLPSISQRIIFHSVTGHFYAGNGMPLSTRGNEGSLYVPPDTYLLRTVHPIAKKQTYAQSAFVSDSYLKWYDDEDYKLPPSAKKHISNSNNPFTQGHAYVPRVKEIGGVKRRGHHYTLPIDMLSGVAPTVQRNYIQSLLADDQYNREVSVEDREVMRNIALGLKYPPGLSISNTLRRAVKDLHPNKRTRDSPHVAALKGRFDQKGWSQRVTNLYKVRHNT